MEKTPSLNQAPLGNTSLQKPFPAKKSIVQNTGFPAVTNSVPPPSETTVKIELRAEAKSFIPKNAKPTQSLPGETPKQIQEIKQVENKESQLKQKIEAKTEQDSKTKLNINAKEFAPQLKVQVQSSYQQPVNPSHNAEQNFNKGNQNEYSNQPFYPSMYPYNQMPPNMAAGLPPNVNQMMQKSISSDMYFTYSQNYLAPYPQASMYAHPNLANPHIIYSDAQNPKKFGSTLPENKLNNELPMKGLNKDAPSYVNKKKTSETKISEIGTPNDDKSQQINKINRSVKIENPGQIPNYAAGPILTAQKDGLEKEENSLSAENQADRINQDKNENIVNPIRISNFNSDEREVSKYNKNSELFDIVKNNLEISIISNS